EFHVSIHSIFNNGGVLYMKNSMRHRLRSTKMCLMLWYSRESPFILFLEAEPLPVAVCAFLDDAFVLVSGADCTDDCGEGCGKPCKFQIEPDADLFCPDVLKDIVRRQQVETRGQEHHVQNDEIERE